VAKANNLPVNMWNSWFGAAVVSGHPENGDIFIKRWSPAVMGDFGRDPVMFANRTIGHLVPAFVMTF